MSIIPFSVDKRPKNPVILFWVGGRRDTTHTTTDKENRLPCLITRLGARYTDNLHYRKW